MTKKILSEKELSIGSVKTEKAIFEKFLEYLLTFSKVYKERSFFFSTWNWPRLFFIFCFFFFFLVKFSLSVFPLASRAEPVEPDDAYRYMAQAVVMKECFSGDCPAVSSLEEQTRGPVQANAKAFQRLRVDMHLFNYFHPGYSLVFNLLHETGLSLVGAHNLIFVISATLMLVIVAAWMLSLWGNIAAGIGLLLISSHVLGTAELSIYTPSNISLMLGIASWTLILQKSKTLTWLAPILWFAAIGMHTMGLLHVAVALLLLILTSSWPLPSNLRRLFIIGISLFALRIAISFAIPEFGLVGSVGNFYAQVPSLGTMINSGINTLVTMPKQWANTYWSYYALAFFLTAGFLTIPKRRRSNVFVMGLALLLAFIASSAYFHPQHGNTATARMWTPLFFFLSGVVGNFIYRWLLAIADFTKLLIQKSSTQWMRKSSILSARGWLEAILLLIGLLIAQSFSNYVGIGIKQHRLTLEDSLYSANLSMDNTLIMNLKNRLETNEAVLFTQETPLYHALANGLLENEVVYPPLLSGAEQTQKFISSNQSLSYFVMLNPLRNSVDFPTGAIPIDQEHAFSFSGGDLFDPVSISVWLENPGDEIVLTLLYGEDKQVAKQLNLSAGYNGWISLPASDELIAKIVFGELQSRKLLIRGITLSEDQDTNWPWDLGIEFTYDDVTVLLSSNNLLEEFELDTEIIADGGSLILGKIIR